MKKFIGLYWKIEKSKDGLWANYYKSGHKINHVVACQVAKESDIKAFVFILGKYMLIVAKLIDVTTGKEIDTWWKERATNCSKELETMDYSVWQYDGDTYNWIIRHKNANGAMSETYLSHKDLVKFTERLKADTLHPKFVERHKAFGPKDRPVTEAIKRNPERVKEGGVVHLNIPKVKPPLPTTPQQPPQKKDK